MSVNATYDGVVRLPWSACPGGEGGSGSELAVTTKITLCETDVNARKSWQEMWDWMSAHTVGDDLDLAVLEDTDARVRGSHCERGGGWMGTRR